MPRCGYVGRGVVQRGLSPLILPVNQEAIPGSTPGVRMRDSLRCLFLSFMPRTWCNATRPLSPQSKNYVALSGVPVGIHVNHRPQIPRTWCNATRPLSLHELTHTYAGGNTGFDSRRLNEMCGRRIFVFAKLFSLAFIDQLELQSPGFNSRRPNDGGSPFFLRSNTHVREAIPGLIPDVRMVEVALRFPFFWLRHFFLITRTWCNATQPLSLQELTHTYAGGNPGFESRRPNRSRFRKFLFFYNSDVVYTTRPLLLWVEAVHGSKPGFDSRRPNEFFPWQPFLYTGRGVVQHGLSSCGLKQCMEAIPGGTPGVRIIEDPRLEAVAFLDGGN
ncbi:hypothetical protein B0H16DRAFT_1460953 [Mycena metata]|uniref:Uncharacterized protein n=1 Tax=Mycena metata TaxID=1033252 RepID=A0AAD7IUW0_9AGAR|nr:hypothetical protein B0H16DRAFT_1460953 [Mycena metata]